MVAPALLLEQHLDHAMQSQAHESMIYYSVVDPQLMPEVLS